MSRTRTSLLATGVTVLGLLSGPGAALAATPADGLVSSVQQTVSSATGSAKPVTDAVTQTVKTVTDAAAPATGAAAPATGTADSVSGAAKPVTDAAAPVNNAVKQVTDAAAPVQNAVKPVTDAAAPLNNAVKPVTDAAAPVKSALKPVTDAAKPVTDAAAPVTGALKPVTDAAAPVLGDAAPVTTSSKAVERTNVPLGLGDGDILSDNDIEVEVGDVLSDLVDAEVTCNAVGAVLLLASNEADCAGKGKGKDGGKGKDDGQVAAYNAPIGGGDIGSDNDIEVEVGDVLSDLVDLDVSCNAVGAVLLLAENEADCGGKGKDRGKGKDKDDGKVAAYNAPIGGGDIGSDNEVDVEVGDVLSDLIDLDVSCNAVSIIALLAENEADCGGKGKGKDGGKVAAYNAEGSNGDGGGDILSDNDIEVEIGDVLSDLVDAEVTCNAVSIIALLAENEADCSGKGGKGRKEDKAVRS